MAGAVLVDANVLLDVLTADPQWLSWSSTELRQAMAGGVVAVNPIICAEIAPAFDFDWIKLDDWLAQAGIFKEPLPFEASTVAAAAHREYRRRGGMRETPLPDFYIGAHAEFASCRLLTRDDARPTSRKSRSSLRSVGDRVWREDRSETLRPLLPPLALRIGDRPALGLDFGNAGAGF